MHCERARAEEFHSPEQRAFSHDSVRLLTKKESFLSYETHKTYLEQLQYSWLLAPFILFLCFYSDVICGLYANKPFPFGIVGSTVVTMWPSIYTIIGCGLLAYGFGVASMCAFAGNFTDYVPASRISGYVLSIIAAQGLSVIFLGVSDSNHLIPFQANSANGVNGTIFGTFDGHLSASTIFFEKLPSGYLSSLLLDIVLPMQGPIVFGLLVFAQRQQHWKRSLHWPLSLVSIPVCCIVASLIWFHASHGIVAVLRKGGAVGFWANSQLIVNTLMDDAHSGLAGWSAFAVELAEARSSIPQVWSQLFTQHICSGRTLYRLWSFALTQGSLTYFLAIVSSLTAAVFECTASGLESLLFSSFAESSATVRFLIFGSASAVLVGLVLAADSQGLLTAGIVVAVFGCVGVLVTSCVMECDDD